MTQMNCHPKAVVGDMAFFTDVFRRFWAYYGCKPFPTGARTPWPNRAETAVRLFKRQYYLMLHDLSHTSGIGRVTAQQVVQTCVWARNTQLTVSGFTPLELATGRRPPDLLDVELLTPEQLSLQPPASETRSTDLRRMAIKAHLEARQADDLRRDLAHRVRPSSGPFLQGDKVYVWLQTNSQAIKDHGSWEPGKVVSHDGPMVTVETKSRLVRVNGTKVRRMHDPWHDIPLPKALNEFTRTEHDRMVLMSSNPFRDMLEVGQPPFLMSEAAGRRGQEVAVPLELRECLATAKHGEVIDALVRTKPRIVVMDVRRTSSKEEVEPWPHHRQFTKPVAELIQTVYRQISHQAHLVLIAEDGSHVLRQPAVRRITSNQGFGTKVPVAVHKD